MVKYDKVITTIIINDQISNCFKFCIFLQMAKVAHVIDNDSIKESKTKTVIFDEFWLNPKDKILHNDDKTS
jgi:hypothetical protein